MQQKQKVTIYYGLSGTMKGSTISSLGPDVKVMESAIKPWKHYQFGLFKDLVQDNDLTYGILHLVRLQEFLRLNKGKNLLAIERSISDCLFYNNNSEEFGDKNKLGESKIQELVEEEMKLLGEFDVTRILLIQKDEDFIRDVILKEPTRKKTFNGSLDLYLELQDKYVRWTEKYNKLNKVNEIYNAKEYIETVLGMEYLNNK